MANSSPSSSAEITSSSVDIGGQNILITPTPIALVLGRQDGTSGRKIFSYPGCRDDSTGPCQLLTSSSEACKKEFTTLELPFYLEQYCMCTNDYYARSSECYVDCYHYGTTSLDTESLSRGSRMVELDCESYSLAIESVSAFYNSLSLRGSSIQNRSATAITGIGAGSTLRDAGPAATASGVSPGTMNWVDRPTMTGQRQEGRGVPTIGAARYNALVSVTVVLAVLAFFHGAYGSVPAELILRVNV